MESIKITTISFVLFFLLIFINSVHAMNWTEYHNEKPSSLILCSGAVDCQNEDIISLANKLRADTPEETIKNNIKWIYKNIEYDRNIIKPVNILYNLLFKPNTYYRKASDVLNEKTGICNHHALLFNAISKAQGLSVKTYETCAIDECNFENKYLCDLEKKLMNCTMKHIHNRVWLNNEWIFIDATSGEYKYSKFNYNNEIICNPYALSFTKNDCTLYSWVNY